MTTNATTALRAVPTGLRDPLLKEYRSITSNYAEHRWSPSELSGGHFCEIVYTIVDGFGSGTYAPTPTKPKDFVGACRSLENRINVPRSFQILIPRALPTLYEVRNNRGVGHAGSDVDPNHMDATLVLGMCNWILAELVRVFHNLPIADAQRLVDSFAERRVPLIWEDGNLKRVLDPSLKLGPQAILLMASSGVPVSVSDLQDWLDYDNKQYLLKTLREYHAQRLINLSKDGKTAQLLPPGSKFAADIVSKATADIVRA